jgi:hypothetical protein
MTKYQKMFEEMWQTKAVEFEEFKKIHDLYKADQTKWKEEFDRRGKPILRTIEEWENRLCGKMEGSGKGMFSANVAEKFREEVRKYLPLVDLIGVKFD